MAKLKSPDSATGKQPVSKNQKPAASLRPDSKGRISLGPLAKGVSKYKLTVDPSSGRITLDPYVEIPAREKWLYENPAALQVKTGLEEAALGKLVRR